MTELLGKLFGSIDRVKIMRLFLMNPDKAFTKASVSRRSKVAARTLTRELRLLSDLKFIKQKQGVEEEEGGSGRKKGWQLDRSFPLLTPVNHLLFNTEPFRNDELVKKFKGAGRIRLIVTAGIFIQGENSRADILIVGDNLKRRALTNALRSIEAEVGRELTYGIFETEEFKYRLTVYDKFVRDLLDYPHEVVLDKLGITA
ncbi:MAG: hypothetical protein COV10_01685 [Candidatus Vogelbacteria bacterium CG10_big_fil_rev_8_21_14_0_10_51_16]|uniref:Transcriptional regulator n=1 Tax=Candidatus Vogelbacteria bacterium CG10_big_fil_rev_8_21_14_0_10_51_16 TaxID=1975045 RepID=A0A2H0REX9_9BACT|nr:MAG: hypothetical protein COV10_01685 [Candidatus Vogelbacteria bacterium CG10_big_fil_rev_8_21_14_0_10_51_16]